MGLVSPSFRGPAFVRQIPLFRTCLNHFATFVCLFLFFPFLQLKHSFSQKEKDAQVAFSLNEIISRFRYYLL